MALLKTKDHHPQPCYWKEPVTSVNINWTPQKSWAAFYQECVQFCERNGQPIPSDADVQAFVCKQLAPGWCSSTPNFQPVPEQGREGCATCGGR